MSLVQEEITLQHLLSEVSAMRIRFYRSSTNYHGVYIARLSRPKELARTAQSGLFNVNQVGDRIVVPFVDASPSAGVDRRSVSDDGRTVGFALEEPKAPVHPVQNPR